MQKYSYKAYDSYGKFVKGTVIAADEKAFRDILHEQGMRCYESRIVNKAKEMKYKPLKIAELIAFSRQLSSMLSSGLDLSLSLKMLYERTEKSVTVATARIRKIAIRENSTAPGRALLVLSEEERATSAVAANPAVKTAVGMAHHFVTKAVRKTKSTASANCA